MFITVITVLMGRVGCVGFLLKSKIIFIVMFPFVTLH